jgi:hypothetical protein
MDFLVLVLFLLFVKHWYFDFVVQTQEEIQWKGVYLDWRGVKHSVKHGIGTFSVIALVDIDLAFILGVLDLLLHYHIDWFKVRVSLGYKPTDRLFWIWFGSDQLAHSLTYLLIVWIWTNQFLAGS